MSEAVGALRPSRLSRASFDPRLLLLLLSRTFGHGWVRGGLLKFECAALGACLVDVHKLHLRTELWCPRCGRSEEDKCRKQCQRRMTTVHNQGQITSSPAHLARRPTRRRLERGTPLVQW